MIFFISLIIYVLIEIKSHLLDYINEFKEIHVLLISNLFIVKASHSNNQDYTSKKFHSSSILFSDEKPDLETEKKEINTKMNNANTSEENLTNKFKYKTFYILLIPLLLVFLRYSNYFDTTIFSEIYNDFIHPNLKLISIVTIILGILDNTVTIFLL